MNSSPMPSVDPPTEITKTKTQVNITPEFENLFTSALTDAVMVPVALTMPNTPPMMKMKKMMSADFSIPRGTAVKKPRRPTGVAFPSAESPRSAPFKE